MVGGGRRRRCRAAHGRGGARVVLLGRPDALRPGNGRRRRAGRAAGHAARRALDARGVARRVRARPLRGAELAGGRRHAHDAAAVRGGRGGVAVRGAVPGAPGGGAAGGLPAHPADAGVDDVAGQRGQRAAAARGAGGRARALGAHPQTRRTLQPRPSAQRPHQQTRRAPDPGTIRSRRPCPRGDHSDQIAHHDITRSHAAARADARAGGRGDRAGRLPVQRAGDGRRRRRARLPRLLPGLPTGTDSRPAVKVALAEICGAGGA